MERRGRRPTLEVTKLLPADADGLPPYVCVRRLSWDGGNDRLGHCQSLPCGTRILLALGPWLLVGRGALAFRRQAHRGAEGHNSFALSRCGLAARPFVTPYRRCLRRSTRAIPALARSLPLCLSLSVCLPLLPPPLSLILHLHYADRATLAFDVRFFVLQRTSLRFFDCVSVDWQRTPLMSCMQFVVLPTQGRTMSSKRCVQNPACTFRQATFLPLHTQTTFFILHTQFAMLLPQSNQYFRALAWACQGNCDKYSLEQKSSCKSW